MPPSASLTSRHVKIGLVLAAALLLELWILLPGNHALYNIRPPATFMGSPLPFSRSDRPLITYVYAESDNARENLKFFLARGLHGAADFVFVFNGETDASSLVPELPHIQIVKRPNTCFDMGAIGEVLRKEDLWKRYKRFITVNASVRGPFLPVWSSACWSDMFLAKLTDTNKLVGMTLNCWPRPHIQSMVLATDHVGMATLLDPSLATNGSEADVFGTDKDPVGFSGCYDNWASAVHAEIGTSALIMNSGFTVDALFTSLHAEAGVERYCQANPDTRDVLQNNAYFGGNVHPYETLFIKANRNIDPSLMQSMTSWHLRMNTSSFDTCGSA